MHSRMISLSALLASILGLGYTASASAEKQKTIELALTEKGFEPASVMVEKGKPVTLVITRKTEQTCAKEIVIDDPKVRAELPLNKPVKVTFTPKKAGELKYGCAMNKMVGGIIHVH